MEIRRSDLLAKLRTAAIVRSVVTLSFGLVTVIVTGALVTASIIQGAWVLVAFFGPPLVLSAILTELVCKPMVKCPHCSASLWKCGTGNFKPRRMRIRDDAKTCPNCHADFV